MENKYISNKGFSLVELIIVIAIIAVLTGIAAPMYVMYLERSREAVDVQNMDNAYRIAYAVYTEDPEATGTYYYYFDGNDIKTTAPAEGYGKGGVVDRHTEYSNPCCEEGQYDGSQDYSGRYLKIMFPDLDAGETQVHVHWSE